VGKDTETDKPPCLGRCSVKSESRKRDLMLEAGRGTEHFLREPFGSGGESVSLLFFGSRKGDIKQKGGHSDY
jgi:hypothetical protein